MTAVGGTDGGADEQGEQAAGKRRQKEPVKLAFAQQVSRRRQPGSRVRVGHRPRLLDDERLALSRLDLADAGGQAERRLEVDAVGL